MSYVTFNQSAVTGVINTITGNAGGAVGPSGAHNVDVVGSGVITVTGVPATNTLTVSFSGVLSVPEGGTGVGTLTDHGVLVGSGTGAVTPLAEATDGQLIIGSTGNDPVLANLTSTGATISITNGAGSINIESVAAPGTVTTLDGDTGSAVPAAGVITVAGGTNITTAGGANTVTVNLDASIDSMAAVDFASGGRIGTATGAGNTTLLEAYDVDGASYVTFATLTANNTPTMDLSDDVTKSGGYIYRAGGTDVAVADGGTGVSTLTDHGILLGSGAAAITALGVATDGQLVIGSTGADPVVASLASAGGTIAFTPGAGTLNLETGGAVSSSFPTDGGTATPAAGALTIAGGANITSSGAAATVTVDLDTDLTALSSITMADGGSIRTSTGAADTVLFQAYDVDGAVYSTFATLTSANDPSMNLADNVTKGGGYIYRAGGTDVPVADGGTGASSLTDHGVLVGSGTAAVTALATGTATQILQSGGAGSDPVWSTATYPATTSQGDLFYSSSANTISSLAKDATATRYLANTGATNNPAWDQVNLANGVTGTLPVGNGGTGAASLTDHGALIGSGSGAITAASVGTNGQVFLGATGADPAFATLTSNNSTISFTTGANSLAIDTAGTVCVSVAGDSGTAIPSGGALTIAGGTNVTTSASGSTVTINASGGGGGGITWNEVTGTSQSMATDNGYITNNASLVTCTLPSSAAVGTVERVCGKGAGGWKIAQNAGQGVFWDESTATTSGTGGYLQSTDDYDAVELVCITADTYWVVISSKGNVTVV